MERLILKVSMTDVDLFERLVDLVKSTLQDKRIPKDLREEAFGKLDTILEDVKYR